MVLGCRGGWRREGVWWSEVYEQRRSDEGEKKIKSTNIPGRCWGFSRGS